MNPDVPGRQFAARNAPTMPDDEKHSSAPRGKAAKVRGKPGSFPAIGLAATSR
jgi:hypothetical protein